MEIWSSDVRRSKELQERRPWIGFGMHLQSWYLYWSGGIFLYSSNPILRNYVDWASTRNMIWKALAELVLLLSRGGVCKFIDGASVDPEYDLVDICRVDAFIFGVSVSELYWLRQEGSTWQCGLEAAVLQAGCVPPLQDMVSLKALFPAGCHPPATTHSWHRLSPHAMLRALLPPQGKAACAKRIC